MWMYDRSLTVAAPIGAATVSGAGRGGARAAGATLP